MDNRTNLVKIGKHISELRKQNGYTQKKLGELLDVSDKTISKWEQGSIAPDITILQSVAKTLGVSVDEILLGEPINNDEFRNNCNDLSVYTNQTRKKVFRDIIIFFFFFSIIVLLLLTVKNIDKWNVRKISVDGTFLIKGDIFESDSKNLIHIDSVVPQNELINDNIKMIEFDLVINEQIAHKDSITNESLKSFEENISLYKLSFYYYQKIDDKIIFRVNVFYKDGHSTAFDYLI